MLRTTTAGQPEAPIRSASRWSWWVTPDGGVDDQQGDVGPVERVEGPQRPSSTRSRARSATGRRMPAVSTKQTGPSGRLDHGVDGVAGGAGQVVDDRALVADQPVEQRRLADVGPPDEGHPRACGAVGPSAASAALLRPARRSSWHRRAAGDHLVEQVARPPTVQGADRPRVAEAERDELPGVGLPAGVVDLVDHQAHRAGRPAGAPGHGQVLVGDPDGHVDHQQDDVGLGDGPLGLRAHLGVEGVAGGQPAAGVDDVKGTPAHSASSTLRSRVTPGSLLDDGRPTADDAVDERRLARRWAGRRRPPAGSRGRSARGADAPSDRHAGGRSSGRPPSSAGAARAVGRHDLDRPGQVGHGQVVEEPALGQAGVGKQVAVAVGLVGQDARPGRRR